MRLLLLALVLSPLLALAAPERGEPFPVIRAEDVAGHSQSTAKYRGKKTLVVAISDRNASEDMRAWYAAADHKMPSTVQRLSIISLKLPFFFGKDKAQARAREQIPEAYWSDNLLDTRGEMAQRLGISGGTTVWVFALDEKGRVLERFHGPVNAPGADAIWKALSE